MADATWKKLAYEDDVVLKSLFTAAGDVLVGSGAGTAGVRPLQAGWTAFNDGDGLMDEAAETVSFATSIRKLAAVDLSTTIALTDPGYSTTFELMLTKSADAVERTIAWHADTGLDHAANWVNSDPLTTMGTTSGKRYFIILKRLNAANRWLASKHDGGVLT